MGLKIYNSKITTAYTCHRKYHLTYREQIAPLVTGKNLTIGSGFHKGPEVFGTLSRDLTTPIPLNEMIAISAKDIRKTVDNPELSEVSVALFDTLATDQTAGFNTCDFIEIEQAYMIHLSPEVIWCIKPDSVIKMIDADKPSMGEYKSSSGYGPKMQIQFHRDPQVWGYFLGLVKFIKRDLNGIQLWIVTKTKTPKVFSEFIPITELRMKQAWENISNGIKYIQMIEKEQLKGKNRYACFGMYGQCEFLDLCEYEDEKYIQTILNSSFKHKDPEAHIELEKAKEVIVDV